MARKLLDSGPFQKEAFAMLVYWIAERLSILRQKQAGAPRPWTADPILDRYRFCNVFREDDAVTAWISSNWRKPYAKDKDLWLAMVIARLFNLPSTLQVIHHNMFTKKKVEWRPDAMKAALVHLRHNGPIFNGAYIVSTNGRAMDKVEYLFQCVLLPMYKDSVRLQYAKGDTLASYHARLMEYDGMGSFMAAQVVADLKNTVGQPLNKATDWYTWAASGPGSRRGMHRVLGHEDYDAGFPEAKWQAAMAELLPLVKRATGIETLHAQDLQNCLCEFDKYCRAKFGQGTPKQMYKPKDLPW